MSSKFTSSQQAGQHKKVTSEKNKFKFQQASSAIAGTADGLKRQLAKLDTGTCSSCASSSSKQTGSGQCPAVLVQYKTDCILYMYAELKEDIKGRAEFVEYLTRLQIQRADLQDRIDKNKDWIVSTAAALRNPTWARSIALPSHSTAMRLACAAVPAWVHAACGPVFQCASAGSSTATESLNALPCCRTTLRQTRMMAHLRHSTRSCWRRYSRYTKAPKSSTARWVDVWHTAQPQATCSGRCCPVQARQPASTHPPTALAGACRHYNPWMWHAHVCVHTCGL